MMPVGMTFCFKAMGDLPPETLAGNWTGRFLGEVTRRVNLSEEGLRKDPAPFAISSPMHAGGGRSTDGGDSDRRWRAIGIREGERFRVRLSWLVDADAMGLLDWARSVRVDPLRVEMQGGRLLVEDASVSPTLAQRWNRWLSYGQLYGEASDCLRFVTLKFYSPTTLQRSGRPYPLPDPSEIFLGYARRWDAFSGIALAPGLREAIEDDLVLVDFRIQRRLSEADRETVPGFIGSASFRLQGRHPESVLRGMNALADYAFFCGTGIGTVHGMGLTRRILQGDVRT